MSFIWRKIHFFVVYLAPPLFVGWCIFYLSSQSGLGDIPNNVLEIVLRKIAHFLEYGFLTFLIWRVFYWGLGFSLKLSLWFTFLLTISYAGTDEWHQSFVIGRSGRVIDVLIDSLSVVVVLQIISYFRTGKIKNIFRAILVLVVLGGIVSEMMWQAKHSQKEEVIFLGRKSECQEVIKNDSLSGCGDKISEKVKKSSSFSGQKVIENKDAGGQLPTKVLYQVPFTSQSPFAKWDQLHEEVCEEASLIMLKYHNDGKELTKQTAEKEIQKLVKYQLKKYGEFHDSDMNRLKRIGEEYFGLDNLKIIVDFTLEDLKRELALGNIILIPTAGRELHNPNFKAPGPLYHNLVVIGYDDTAIKDSAGRKVDGVFITNDPGTRKGAGYKYDQEILYRAIHDFPGNKNKILTGEKRAIVLVH